MTLSEFNSLAPGEQFDEQTAYGVFLGNRDTNIFAFHLYQLHDFYVEVRFNKSKEVVDEIKTFESQSIYLDQYLQDIIIDFV